jgi:Macrocin-O-methyltransferase (TylF)
MFTAATDRIVWAADSFEGLPNPIPRFPKEAAFHRGQITQKLYNNADRSALPASSRRRLCNQRTDARRGCEVLLVAQGELTPAAISPVIHCLPGFSRRRISAPNRLL